MKIGIDLDGIVVDFPGSLRKELIKTIGFDYYSKPALVDYYYRSLFLSQLPFQ